MQIRRGDVKYHFYFQFTSICFFFFFHLHRDKQIRIFSDTNEASAGWRHRLNSEANSTKEAVQNGVIY